METMVMPDGTWSNPWVVAGVIVFVFTKIYELVSADIDRRRRIANEKVVVANQVETHAAIQEVKKATNGLTDKLVGQTALAEHARGMLDQRAESAIEAQRTHGS